MVAELGEREQRSDDEEHLVSCYIALYINGGRCRLYLSSHKNCLGTPCDVPRRNTFHPMKAGEDDIPDNIGSFVSYRKREVNHVFEEQRRCSDIHTAIN